MSDANQTLTVNLQQALHTFERMRMQDIRDIRTIDTDLLLVLRNGQRIVWQEGALTVLLKPELVLVFKDGALKAEQLFRQIETIDINAPKNDEVLIFDSSYLIYHTDAVHSQHVTCIEQRWILI